MASAQPNPFLLAADNPSQLLPLLRSKPELAASQDEHGYSLIHAATSYNHLDLLRALVNEFHVDVNLKDEDGETALFVVETMDCAKVLVEELHASFTVRGTDGKTPRERIEEEGDFPEVAVYLRIKELESSSSPSNGNALATGPETNGIHPPPPLPEGVSLNIGTMNPQEEVPAEADPEFRRRIEELAARPDFQSEAGQQELRQLITEALGAEFNNERDVRQRTS
ncbi:hypothetical protein F5884DRAFT_674409 [Xylogone sp. PMI_703]|nr:hypothetical protein F5884DRAFT_674409 [Xylogone sp. PMI_703]